MTPWELETFHGDNFFGGVRIQRGQLSFSPTRELAFAIIEIFSDFFRIGVKVHYVGVKTYQVDTEIRLIQL